MSKSKGKSKHFKQHHYIKVDNAQATLNVYPSGWCNVYVDVDSPTNQPVRLAFSGHSKEDILAGMHELHDALESAFDLVEWWQGREVAKLVADGEIELEISEKNPPTVLVSIQDVAAKLCKEREEEGCN
jgi:hypothetical protein